MAQVVLTSVGAALGGPVGGAIGSLIGAAADRAAVEALRPARQVGPRLDGLRVQSTAEGSPMAAVFGRVRIAGEVIWAARFREKREEGRSGGGKGGPKTVDYSYSLSFAVGLCEGVIDGVGRIWADNQLMDMTGVTLRVHRGTADQAPDPLIEAVEGAGAAPAYRHTAYVVFEDLPLAPFGDRLPQLSFEIFKSGGLKLERLLTGVNLIPGAGEFALATEPVLRREGITRTAAENVNNRDGRSDIVVSLDHLQAQFPNVRRVSLVVTWFGDDLRAGHCKVRPAVENRGKSTIPFAWRVNGVQRADAMLLSRAPGTGGLPAEERPPAYGGTPADRAVLQAIAELKARGFEVTLYPFLMMDVPSGNVLPRPDGGGVGQAVYPWRGRITGVAGHSAAAEVASFFGGAAAAEVVVSDGLPSWTGPSGEWSWRRCVLHYARLAELAGGVDGFLIGSELVGLTTLRQAPGEFPAVAALKALAADVKTVVGATCKVSYAADWTEWNGVAGPDGAFFHLDPLWSDPAIDYVGIDWYPPLSDWRQGDGGLDAEAGWSGTHDPDYLRARVNGGEAHDWYYADGAGREGQVRLPITDGAHGEPWMFRPKDVQGWWSHPHHDRPGWVRSATSTDWTPGLKPIRLTEFGCPAADRGANSPNLFPDPKSSESSLPRFSGGERDDLGQRRALEALLEVYEPGTDANPEAADGRSMIEAMDAWCWDARPFPDFPARKEVWADAPNWRLGHWLMGRAGVGSAAELIEALLRRAGISPEDFDLSGVTGVAIGYVVDRPMRVRDMLQPLATAWGFDACERGGRIGFAMRSSGTVYALDADGLAEIEDEPAPQGSRVLEPQPDSVRVRFTDEAADYQVGAVQARLDVETGGGLRDVDIALTTTKAEAARTALRLLGSEGARESATVFLGPEAALRLEPGDQVEAEGLSGAWRVVELTRDERPRARLARPESDGGTLGPDVEPPAPPPTPAIPPPVVHLLDLPPLPGREDDGRPLAAVAADPWRPMDIWLGPDAETLTRRARAASPATVGLTLTALAPGPVWRWDRGSTLQVRMEGVALRSRGRAAVFEGRNTLAVRTPSGDWELLQFETATLIGPDRWSLSGLLRGQCGTETVMAPTPAGAEVVLIDETLVRLDVASAERGLTRMCRAAPAGGPPGGRSMTEATFAWRAAALRPFAPVHLRLRRLADGDLTARWIRRARIGGDAWDGEPPLAEERELWRVRVLHAGSVKRIAELGATAWTYSAAEQWADFGGLAPSGAVIEAAQGSAVVGWGAAATATL